MSTVRSAQNILRILVVDDEKAIRTFLKTSLSAYGYLVFEAQCGREALTKAVDTRPDLIILDLGLPDMDGKEVIPRIRERAAIPLIILSVRDEPLEKVAALERGADDYLTKPFSTAELIARVRAVMRRLVPADKQELLRIGELVMDITKRQVRRVDVPINNLSPTEYDMLKLFMLNAGTVLTHQRLLRELWDKTEEFEGVLHLLRVTVSNLRSKIEPDPDRPTYLLTEPGVGYRFVPSKE